MSIYLWTFLLISNALILRKDQSILFSRIVMVTLILTNFLDFNNLFFFSLDDNIYTYGDLYHLYTLNFNLFIFLISAIILILTSFYPRKVFLNQISYLSFSVFNNGTYKFKYNNYKLFNKMVCQVKIMGNFIIIILAFSDAVFLMSASDLIYIFLAIVLQSYGIYIIFALYRDSKQSTSGNLTHLLTGNIKNSYIENNTKVKFKPENIILSSSLSIAISVLTLILLLFIFIPNELFKLANIYIYIFFYYEKSIKQ